MSQNRNYVPFCLIPTLLTFDMMLRIVALLTPTEQVGKEGVSGVVQSREEGRVWRVENEPNQARVGRSLRISYSYTLFLQIASPGV